MARRYHVNPGGEDGPCNAGDGNCPFGGDSGDDRHFDTPEEAKAFAEKENKERYGATKTVKRFPKMTEGELVAQSEAVFNNDGTLNELEYKIDEDTTFRYAQNRLGDGVRISALDEKINGGNRTTIYSHNDDGSIKSIEVHDDSHHYHGYQGFYRVIMDENGKPASATFLQKGETKPKDLTVSAVSKRLPDSAVGANWDKQQTFDKLQENVMKITQDDGNRHQKFYPSEEPYDICLTDSTFAKNFESYSGYTPTSVYTNYETFTEGGDFTPISGTEEEGFVSYMEIQSENDEFFSVTQQHSISEYDEENGGYWVMTSEHIRNEDTGESEETYVGDSGIVYKDRAEAKAELDKIAQRGFQPSEFIEDLQRFEEDYK